MPLPTFVIAGERRSGSTSLSKWMEAHPEIYLHPKTDMAYFVDSAIVGRREWLDGHVDLADWGESHSTEAYDQLFDAGVGFPAIGEKSADYLYWKPAHKRISEFLPESRFIFILRHPIHRAWSHYWNEVAKERESLTFEDALTIENDRIRESDYASFHLGYRSRGHYDESLENFFNYVPASRCMIVILEKLIANPQEQLKKIYEFIGVDPELGLDMSGTQHNKNWAMVKRSWAKNPPISDLEVTYRILTSKITKVIAYLLPNKGNQRKSDVQRQLQNYFDLVFRYPASTNTMASITYQELQNHYATHNQKLEELVGYPIDEWK